MLSTDLLIEEPKTISVVGPLIILRPADSTSPVSGLTKLPVNAWTV